MASSIEMPCFTIAIIFNCPSLLRDGSFVAMTLSRSEKRKDRHLNMVNMTSHECSAQHSFGDRRHLKPKIGNIMALRHSFPT